MRDRKGEERLETWISLMNALMGKYGLVSSCWVVGHDILVDLKIEAAKGDLSCGARWTTSRA